MQCAITENLVGTTSIGKFNTIFKPNTLRTWHSQHIAINVNRLITNPHGCSRLHNKIWYGLFDCNEKNIIIMKVLCYYPKNKTKKNYKKILQSLHLSKTNMHFYPMQTVIDSFRLNHTI